METGRGNDKSHGAWRSVQSAAASRFKRYRAPQVDGQALLDPEWTRLPELVASNREYARTCEYDFQGESLAELRAAARIELMQPFDEPAGAAERPLIMTGHQPELFHPGVWLKNFAAGGLAQRVGGLGVNLVIDSDLCRTTTLRVPTGDGATPRVELVPYDAPAPPMPHEERRVRDTALLRSFADRVMHTGKGLLLDPMTAGFWTQVIREADNGANLSHAISSARHRVELSWGNETREATIGRVCDGAVFARFAADLLARLPDFHAAHNGALAQYRAAHGLRSPAQPMPDLQQRDDWLETPLWVWTSADPVRRALYARLSSAGLELTDFSHAPWKLAASSSMAGSLDTLRRDHALKVRGRALVTTLFVRLLLADLFLHGIGGAKYDEAADLLAERFYRFRPPPHATVTATLRLPIEHTPFDPSALPRMANELRELEFHPERFLEDDPAAHDAKAEKLRWVSTAKTRENAAERHDAIAAANAAMQPLVEPKRQTLMRERAELELAHRAAAILDSREYAFCLFPADYLRERLLGLVE